MKRRGNGLGYIYYYKGHWYLQTCHGGKKRTQPLRQPGGDPCEDRSEAEQIAALIVNGVDLPASILADQYKSLSDLNAAYLQAFSTRLSASMRANRAIWMRRLLEAFPRAGDVTHERLGLYVQRRLAEKAQTSTINRELSQLRRLLNWAVLVGKLERSPFKGFRLLQEPHHRERVLSEAELAALQAALDAWRQSVNPFHRQTRLIVLLALHTGLRFGEIAGLAWAHVDLERRELHLLKTKSGKKRRVPIPPAMVEELGAWERRGDLVFPSLHKPGTRIAGIERSFKALLKVAGIKEFRFHDLRHTAASWMLRGGVDLNTVREILGHASITTTQRYLNTLEDQKRAAVAWMAGVVGGDKTDS